MIGNLAKDALSAQKYVHFIKLMGRSASHIALECALACQPNLTLIGEEKKSLKEIVGEIAGLIEGRKKRGKEYGVILVPEGLIEFIPEMKALIKALNALLATGGTAERLEEPHRSLFKTLPKKIQDQLILERDPHGNVQVSLIETEQLVHAFVMEELKTRGVTCNGVHHFFGYEGRSCLPSNFDANYGYALGKLSALAAQDGLTGVILALQGLLRPPEEWIPKAVPIARLMHFETRSGKDKPVIAKALVDLKGKAYQRYAKDKEKWKIDDCYLQPGPIQFYGDSSLTDSVPLSL
jgi:pyrophosphate--fructose-6-phosphate 1-phosphotransferase